MNAPSSNDAKPKVWHEWRDKLVENRFGRETYGVLDGIIGGYMRDHGLMYAGAMAFFMLLSLIPLVVLFASLAGYLVSFLADGDSQHNTQAFVGELVSYVRELIPYLSESFEKDLSRMVSVRGQLGVVSGMALLVAASQVFRAIEFAFARIFHGPGSRRATSKPRHAVLSKLVFGAFIFAVVGIFVASKWVLGDLLVLAQSHWPFLIRLGLNPETLTNIGSAGFFSGFLTVVGYTIILKIFALEHIHSRFCMVGGLMFWAGVQIVHRGFDIYLSDFAEMGALYGGLSALMTVVIWMFLMATTFLISAQAVRVMHKRAVRNVYDFEESRAAS